MRCLERSALNVPEYLERFLPDQDADRIDDDEPEREHKVTTLAASLLVDVVQKRIETEWSIGQQILLGLVMIVDRQDELGIPATLIQDIQRKYIPCIVVNLKLFELFQWMNTTRLSDLQAEDVLNRIKLLRIMQDKPAYDSVSARENERPALFLASGFVATVASSAASSVTSADNMSEFARKAGQRILTLMSPRDELLTVPRYLLERGDFLLLKKYCNFALHHLSEHHESTMYKASLVFLHGCVALTMGDFESACRDFGVCQPGSLDLIASMLFEVEPEMHSTQLFITRG